MESNPVYEFRILRKLGEGAYADVYLVKSVKDQSVYAEKRLKKRYRSFDEVNQ
jgi:renal tumor antigen